MSLGVPPGILATADRGSPRLEKKRTDDKKHSAMAKGLVNKKRVRSLSTGDEGAGPVVYWCSRDQRVRDNWALIYACDKAASNGVPVVVVFSLVTKFLGAGARQFGFMLRGLKEMDAALAERGIPFVLLKGDPGETVPAFANAVDAHTLVCDSSPLRLG